MLLQTFLLKIDQFTPVNLILRQKRVQDNLHSNESSTTSHFPSEIKNQRLITAPPRANQTSEYLVEQ